MLINLEAIVPSLPLQVLHCRAFFSASIREGHVALSVGQTRKFLDVSRSSHAKQRQGPGGYSHTLPIRVCAAQRGRDFEASDLERGIHFRGVF